MTILVTGGAGYIGSHTVVELLERDFDVVVVDDLSNSSREVIRRIEELTNKNFTFYEHSIADQKAMEQVFADHDIQSVIHFAGYKAVGESVEQPLKYYHNNIGGTVALLEVMQAANVKDIIFSSSATVYGMDNQPPLEEDMPAISATNPYGYSKVVVEHLLEDMYIADSEWSVTILRYFNPLGAHQSGRIGEDPTGVPKNLMPYITQVAIGQRDHLKVFGDDYETHDGTGVRDYIHVVDLALGHIQAIAKNQKQSGVKTYNLGTGIGYSVLDLIHAFEEVSGIEIPYEVTPRRAGDVAINYADPTKAKEELDWQAKYDLLTMCRDSWRWQSQNPHGYEENSTSIEA